MSKGALDAAAFPNSRNGSTPKTVATGAGDVDLRVLRDRDGTFTPRLVPTGSRRLGGLDDIIISLYAGEMTVRDIAHHIAVDMDGIKHVLGIWLQQSEGAKFWAGVCADPTWPTAGSGTC